MNKNLIILKHTIMIQHPIQEYLMAIIMSLPNNVCIVSLGFCNSLYVPTFFIFEEKNMKMLKR